MLGLIGVQTVATTHTDKDLNISFYLFSENNKLAPAHIMCMRQIVSFDIFIICYAKSKGSGETWQWLWSPR